MIKSYLIIALLLFIILELLLSTALLYGYRFTKEEWFVQPNPFFFSSAKIVYDAANKLGVIDSGPDESGTPGYIEVQPAGFHRDDPVLGYAASPGVYTVQFHRQSKHSEKPEFLETKVTINEDGSRWTGSGSNAAESTIYVFGDSYVFGSGVSDEHTFSYLLQRARPDINVKLYALGGYGMAEAYLIFDKFKGEIGEKDSVVLGYADFYDIRNIAAPSRLRELRDWADRRKITLPDRKLVKASVAESGVIQIDYVQQICSQNEGYCDENDPSRLEMTRTTAALVNQIAVNTKAKIYVLHFAGKSDNPVFGMLNKRIHRLSALEDDFDQFIRDSVEDFDNHPGPYWHYALSRFLIDSLAD